MSKYDVTLLRALAHALHAIRDRWAESPEASRVCGHVLDRAASDLLWTADRVSTGIANDKAETLCQLAKQGKL